MLLFLTTNMAAVTSRANQQLPIDLSRIPVNKGTNWRLEMDKIQSNLSTMATVGTEESSRCGEVAVTCRFDCTVVCMKLSIKPSSSFLYVCSLERNAGYPGHQRFLSRTTGIFGVGRRPNPHRNRKPREKSLWPPR